MNEVSTADAADLRSGKGHRNENFPVASFLIHPRHRAPILAFYNFVRTADDIADHPSLAPEQKLVLLERLDGGLTGENDADEAALVLRAALATRGLSPRHAQDLLTAFKMDVTKLRYSDWNDLLHYCSYSAMPVGRFVLDVHGESRTTWPANDALCAALQVINHLQDCKDDYRNLDRVYIPLDILAAHGAGVEALSEPEASPALLAALRELAGRTDKLLTESDIFPVLIGDRRLALEVSVINALAHRLTRILMVRDPLSDRVHLSMPGVAGVTLAGIVSGAFRRLSRRASATAQTPRGA
jgi:squalene synthase HpnC